MLVVVNVRNEAHSIPTPGMWSNRTVVNLMNGMDVDLGSRIMLEPYQYLLLGNK